MEYTLNFRDIWTQTDALLGGIGVTLAISTLTIAVGLIIGSAGAAGSIYGGKLLRSGCGTTITVFARQ